jgi:uncharacterized repeat protein (TIGR03803 family)
MKVRGFCYTLSISAAAALLAGCGGSQPPIATPQSSANRLDRTTGPRTSSSSSYHVLYSFAGTPDGATPLAGLINVKGRLYGTTQSGGSTGNGVVYRISTTGIETVLYRFAGGSDGRQPQAGLLDVNGMLYGTTYLGGGGPSGYGTVYSISTAGAEKVLHSFAGARTDGAYPNAALIDLRGTLYGTTLLGGSKCPNYGCGTVYSISTTGSENVLYSFRGGSDGAQPYAGLINVKGTLYGATFAGGSSDNGTVYSISTTGVEKVLYRFRGSPDGAHPQGGLVVVNGTLYGTTYQGGSGASPGNGTVYSVSVAGKEKVLHRFTGGSDGVYPTAGMINVKGTLYGTTSLGGSSCGIDGCGTVYNISTAGLENVLHRFKNGSDGQAPGADLIDSNGTLYGTTVAGGNGPCLTGCGIVFALSP